MSSRNIRRLVAEKEQQERDKKKEEEEKEKAENDELPEEYSPHYVQMNPAFEGLDVSSDSESDLSVLSDLADNELDEDLENDELEPYQDEAAAVIPEEDKYGAKKKVYTQEELDKKAKRENKKNRKNKKKDKKPEEMDEVEWSVQQVNQILGSPPEKVEEIVDERALEEKRLFAILPNNINVNYELAKVFGDENRLQQTLKSRPHTRRLRHEIGLSPDVNPFRIKGLSMTRCKTENNIKYFKFEHSHDYKMRCQTLVDQLKNMLFGQSRHENNLHSENCVEALIENCEYLYSVEEHKGANQALEQAIFAMQAVGEPSFNFVDGKTRLEYEYVENRPFHIAVLKYLHVLTNIACHRTALELAKVLLNLDPSDPMAVIFIIDTLAIRAREHQWLLDLIDFWREKRQAHRLFHMRYSQALALFHVGNKNKDFDKIDFSKYALTKAIKNFPHVALKIMEFSKLNVPIQIMTHELFVHPHNVAVCKDFDELMTLYAWLIGPRFRELSVWRWFMGTVTKLLEEYDRNLDVRDEIMDNAKLRVRLYRRLPTEMKRHVYAIRAMTDYIAEGHMPQTKPSVSFNPYPCEGTGTDTYDYFTSWVDEYTPPPNALMALIQGIYPEMYQLGRKNMSAMLQQLNGVEIRVERGIYMIIGPRIYDRTLTDDEMKRFRAVFISRPSAAMVHEMEPMPMPPFPDPQYELEPVAELHNGIPRPPAPEDRIDPRDLSALLRNGLPRRGRAFDNEAIRNAYENQVNNELNNGIEIRNADGINEGEGAAMNEVAEGDGAVMIGFPEGDGAAMNEVPGGDGDNRDAAGNNDIPDGDAAVANEPIDRDPAIGNEVEELDAADINEIPDRAVEYDNRNRDAGGINDILDGDVAIANEAIDCDLAIAIEVWDLHAADINEVPDRAVDNNNPNRDAAGINDIPDGDAAIANEPIDRDPAIGNEVEELDAADINEIPDRAVECDNRNRDAGGINDMLDGDVAIANEAIDCDLAIAIEVWDLHAADINEVPDRAVDNNNPNGDAADINDISDGDAAIANEPIDRDPAIGNEVEELDAVDINEIPDRTVECDNRNRDAAGINDIPDGDAAIANEAIDRDLAIAVEVGDLNAANINEVPERVVDHDYFNRDAAGINDIPDGDAAIANEAIDRDLAIADEVEALNAANINEVPDRAVDNNNPNCDAAGINDIPDGDAAIANEAIDRDLAIAVEVGDLNAANINEVPEPAVDNDYLNRDAAGINDIPDGDAAIANEAIDRDLAIADEVGALNAADINEVPDRAVGNYNPNRDAAGNNEIPDGVAVAIEVDRDVAANNLLPARYANRVPIPLDYENLNLFVIQFADDVEDDNRDDIHFRGNMREVPIQILHRNFAEQLNGFGNHNGAGAPIPNGARAPFPNAARAPVPNGARAPFPNGARAPIPNGEFADNVEDDNRDDIHFRGNMREIPIRVLHRNLAEQFNGFGNHNGAGAPIPNGARAPFPNGARAPFPNGARALIPNGARAPIPNGAGAPIRNGAGAPIPNGAAAPVPNRRLSYAELHNGNRRRNFSEPDEGYGVAAIHRWDPEEEDEDENEVVDDEEDEDDGIPLLNGLNVINIGHPNGPFIWENARMRRAIAAYHVDQEDEPDEAELEQWNRFHVGDAFGPYGDEPEDPFQPNH